MIGKTISHYKILEKLGDSDMPCFSKNYNALVPPAGDVIYKAGNIHLKHIVMLNWFEELQRKIPTGK